MSLVPTLRRTLFKVLLRSLSLNDFYCNCPSLHFITRFYAKPGFASRRHLCCTCFQVAKDTWDIKAIMNSLNGTGKKLTFMKSFWRNKCLIQKMKGEYLLNPFHIHQNKRRFKFSEGFSDLGKNDLICPQRAILPNQSGATAHYRLKWPFATIFF